METYYFGANLMVHILPENPDQPLVRVDIVPPDGRERNVDDGIYGRNEVLAGIRSARKALEKEKPDRIITIGGNCLVSLAPFDYLHGLYENLGIIWIDAHPDVSVRENGYPNAHAMVLGALLGSGESALRSMMRSPAFSPEDVLYVGLQGLHDYQEKFLREAGVNFRVQTDSFLSEEEIRSFVERYDHVLVHLDVDVLDAALFHSTYFANKDLVGDGSSGGRMTMEDLSSVLKNISDHADIAGLTIAEYLPFDEYKLHKMFAGISLLTE